MRCEIYLCFDSFHECIHNFESSFHFLLNIRRARWSIFIKVYECLYGWKNLCFRKQLRLAMLIYSRFVSFAKSVRSKHFGKFSICFCWAWKQFLANQKFDLISVQLYMSRSKYNTSSSSPHSMLPFFFLSMNIFNLKLIKAM